MFGALYDNLRMKNKLQLWYLVFFVLRRIIYVASILFLGDLGVIQLLILMYINMAKYHGNNTKCIDISIITRCICLSLWAKNKI